MKSAIMEHLTSGDNYCDNVLNTAECLYDLGDCSSGPITEGTASPQTISSSTPPPIWSTPDWWITLAPAGPEIPDGCILPEGIPAYWLGNLTLLKVNFFIVITNYSIYTFRYRRRLLR